MTFIELIGIAIGSGSIVYLLVDRITTRKQYKIANGSSTAKLYQEIDAIVQTKTKALEDEVTDLKLQVEDLKTNWCCYRDPCEMRIRSEKDATAWELETDTHTENFVRSINKTKRRKTSDKTKSKNTEEEI